jgi:hypothetical protein
VDTFDPQAGEFPLGFRHDISLVDITGKDRLVKDMCSLTPLGWLSQQDWHKIRFNTSKVYLLNDKSVDAKTIGIADESYNIVGSQV